MPTFIFDLDGTLIDSRESILDSIRFGLKHIGYDGLAFDEVRALRQDLRATLRNAADVAKVSLTDFEVEDFVRSYRAHHALFPDDLIKPFGGVRETLEFLRAQPNTAIAIATTKHSEQAADMLKRLNLAQYFDHIQGTDPGLHYKPSPDILLATLKALDRAAWDGFYMGDSEHDLEAADAAGLMKIAANYGYSNAAELQNQQPLFAFDRFEDFLGSYPEMIELLETKAGLQPRLNIAMV